MRIKTPGQQAQWVRIVANMPGGYFTPEMFQLLKDLCRHIGFSDLLSVRLSRFTPEMLDDPENRADFERLLELHMVQSKQVNLLSSRLRLAPQNRFEPNTAAAALKRHRAQPVRKPWELGNGSEDAPN